MNILPDDKALEIIDRVLKGQSLRKIAREVECAKGTVENYKKIALKIADKPVACPCGRPAFHKGWCRHRLKESPKRMAFLKQWGK